MAQRFTAATSGLFSVLALAAEGNYRVHKEFFRQTVKPVLWRVLTARLSPSPFPTLMGPDRRATFA